LAFLLLEFAEAFVRQANANSAVRYCDNQNLKAKTVFCGCFFLRYDMSCNSACCAVVVTCSKGDNALQDYCGRKAQNQLITEPSPVWSHCSVSDGALKAMVLPMLVCQFNSRTFWQRRTVFYFGNFPSSFRQCKLILSKPFYPGLQLMQWTPQLQQFPLVLILALRGQPDEPFAGVSAIAA